MANYKFMNKNAAAKWRLASLTEMGNDLIKKVAPSATKRTEYSFGGAGFSPGAAHYDAERLADYYNFLYRNKKLYGKMQKFLAENPSFATPVEGIGGNRSHLGGHMRTRADDGSKLARPVVEYHTSTIKPYMGDELKYGTVVKAPTPHEPQRMEFQRVPQEALELNSNGGFTGVVDKTKIPAGSTSHLPLSANNRANSIVSMHMLSNKFGTPLQNQAPSLELANKFGAPSFINLRLPGEPPRSPNYNPIKDVVTMPSPAGYRSFIGHKTAESAGRHTGSIFGIPRPQYFRATYQHEGVGHAGLYRKSEEQLLRDARMAQYLTNKALKGTGLKVDKITGNGYDPLVEFLANYNASNPGTAIRDASVLKFDKGVLPGKLKHKFDSNMASVDPDTVARVKSGLEQLDGNYGAIHEHSGAEGFAKYVADSNRIQQQIADEAAAAAERKRIESMSLLRRGMLASRNALRDKLNAILHKIGYGGAGY